MAGREQFNDLLTNNPDPQASSTTVDPDLTSIHSLIPGRSGSPSSNRSISPDLDFVAWARGSFLESPVNPDLTSIHGISPPMTGQERLKNRLTNKSKSSPSLSYPDIQLPDSNYNLPPPPSSRSQTPDTQLINRSPSYGRSNFNFNSPSLSNRHPSGVIYPAGADLASSGFQDVKATLRRVESATDVFPLIKSTVVGLLGVIDIVEVRDFNSLL